MLLYLWHNEALMIGYKRTFYECVFKRCFDFTLSLLALIILAPLFFIIFIASKISIGGKAIFSQYRPGKNGKVFKLYKFRSMTDKTDENGILLPDEERITKFGKFIRKTSIDELPQLFNILKGDMSIVGPRPRLVKDMVFYTEETMFAYSKKPGLTGPSQVAGGRSEASWESIFEEELKYARKVTLWKDIKILFKTVGILFKSDSSAEGSKSSKREYFYGDYLLSTNKITAQQYAMGLSKADSIIAKKGIVKYSSDLHNNQ